MKELKKNFPKEIDYHRYWKERSEKAEEENLNLRRKLSELEQQVLETGAEIEVVKRKADELMMEKIKKYEDILQKTRESGL